MKIKRDEGNIMKEMNKNKKECEREKGYLMGI